MKIEYDQYKLTNGLNVILHQDDRVPIVAVNVWYDVGSKNERPGKTGFAHLFEHMMFQGSAHVPADLHFKLIQRVGGTLNGSTFFDRTNYYETLPSHYLEMGLWLEADRMGFLLPALDQAKLDNQLDVVKNERRQRVDNQPYGRWLEKILEMAFEPDFPYHWPVIGYMEDLDRVTLDDVREFFRTYYAPNNASLVVAGDFDPAETRELIEKYFADIPAGAVPPAVERKFRSYNQGEKRTVLKDRVQLPRLYMAYHFPEFGTPDAYVTDVISDILSSGRSSRLYQSLVYRQQIAQDAQAVFLPLKLTSLLIIMVTPRPEVPIEKIEQALQRELGDLRNQFVDPDELQRVKNQIEARKIREFQSVASRADQLNMHAVYFNRPEGINDEIEQYRKITIENVYETAGIYLNDNNRVVVTFVPVDGEDQTPQEVSG